MNIGRSGSTRARRSRRSKAHSDGVRTLKKVISGVIMKEKKETSYKVEITISYLSADSGHFEQIKNGSLWNYGDSPIEALLWSMIQMVEQVNPFSLDTYSREAKASMYLQLCRLHRELSNTYAVGTKDRITSSSIFLGVLDGLVDYTRQLRLSRMDWYTILDTTHK